MADDDEWLALIREDALDADRPICDPHQGEVEFANGGAAAFSRYGQPRLLPLGASIPLDVRGHGREVRRAPR